jgi:hypothetical protein
MAPGRAREVQEARPLLAGQGTGLAHDRVPSSMLPRGFIAGRVCRHCNNGWMREPCGVVLPAAFSQLVTGGESLPQLAANPYSLRLTIAEREQHVVVDVLPVRGGARLVRNNPLPGLGAARASPGEDVASE